MSLTKLHHAIQQAIVFASLAEHVSMVNIKLHHAQQPATAIAQIALFVWLI
jgi:hypothetical protein